MDAVREPLLGGWQWPLPSRVEVGTVRTTAASHPCEALVSTPGLDPHLTTPARLKATALERWVAAPRPPG